MAKHDPGEALDLLWQFTALAGPVFERCDDSSGTVIGEFRAACHDLAEIAASARPDPQALADRTFEAICANDYGQYDDLITLLAPALGPDGSSTSRRGSRNWPERRSRSRATRIDA